MYTRLLRAANVVLNLMAEHFAHHDYFSSVCCTALEVSICVVILPSFCLPFSWSHGASDVSLCRTIGSDEQLFGCLVIMHVEEDDDCSAFSTGH